MELKAKGQIEEHNFERIYLDGEDRPLMVRSSGTEPLLRFFAQGPDAGRNQIKI